MPKNNSSVAVTAAVRSHAIDPLSPSPAPDPGPKGSSLPIPASPRELITSNLDMIFNSLKLAGGMVQNVPYIGLVADIMLQILQIRDEVTVFKDKWKDVMNDIKKMKSIIEDYAQTSVQPDGSPSLVLSEDVQGHLRALERLLEDIAQALSRCCPKRKADQLRIILQRRELRSLVDGCKVQLQTELAFFNTRTNLSNNRILQSICRDVPQNKASSQPIKIKYTLPAKPRIMHGRDDIISELVTAILNGSSARLALLGPGGIGKTSIALSVLHHNDIQKSYKDACYFLACDAIETRDALIVSIGQMLGVYPNAEQKLDEARVLDALKNLSNIILCLDNFETV